MTEKERNDKACQACEAFTALTFREAVAGGIDTGIAREMAKVVGTARRSTTRRAPWTARRLWTCSRQGRRADHGRQGIRHQPGFPGVPDGDPSVRGLPAPGGHRPGGESRRRRARRHRKGGVEGRPDHGSPDPAATA